MKKVIYILFVCLFVSKGLAYTYEVYTYGESKTLHDEETILVDLQGGMFMLTLEDGSFADIKGTSPLEQFYGGIWEVRLGYTSSLYMTGGQVNEINIGNEATAELHGGLIQQIWSYQYVPYIGGHGQPSVPNPNIKLYYSGDLPTLDSSNMLTGLWGNGDPFSIYLHNVPGYDPVIKNIQFILVPEPASLALLALGTLLLRRKQN